MSPFLLLHIPIYMDPHVEDLALMSEYFRFHRKPFPHPSHSDPKGPRRLLRSGRNLRDNLHTTKMSIGRHSNLLSCSFEIIQSLGSTVASGVCPRDSVHVGLVRSLRSSIVKRLTLS